MDIELFFNRKPVFTISDFKSWMLKEHLDVETHKKLILNSLLKQKKLVSVRRGIYAVMPEGVDTDSYKVDPYLIASMISPDSLLSFQTAMNFRGVSGLKENKFLVGSAQSGTFFGFQGNEFQSVPYSKVFNLTGKNHCFAETLSHNGVEILVSKLSRAFVDVINKVNLNGGWDNVCELVKNIKDLNLDEVVEYSLLCGNQTLIGKVGCILELKKEALNCSEQMLAKLRESAPCSPQYFLYDEVSRKYKYFRDWNVMVPEDAEARLLSS